MPPLPPPPAPNPVDRPDLQIISSNALGNGSAAVCDKQPIAQGGGGVPGMPDFGPSQTVTDALNDFACRFEAHTPTIPCTLGPNGEDGTVTQPSLPSGSVQFCYIAQSNTNFPLGDTILTVQARDTTAAKNIGPTKQIVVRRVTPVP